MRCKVCGFELPKNAYFCPSCGTRLDTPEEVAQALPRNPYAPAPIVNSPDIDDTQNLKVPQFDQAKGIKPVVPKRHDEDAIVSFGENLKRLGDSGAENIKEQVKPIAEQVSRLDASQKKSLKRLGLALIALVCVLLAGPQIINWAQNFKISPAQAPVSETATEANTEDQTDKEEHPSPQKDEEKAVVAGVEVKKKLSKYSWKEISQIANTMEGLAADGKLDQAKQLAIDYNLLDSEGNPQGDKELVLNDTSILHMQLVDIFHDQLADQPNNNSAALSFVAKELLAPAQMSSSARNDGGWEKSNLRAYLNENFYNNVLNEELRGLIKPVSKLTNNIGFLTDANQLTLTSDKIWLLSYVELLGPIQWTWPSNPAASQNYNAVINSEGSQYKAFANARITTDQAQGAIASYDLEHTSYWLRSTSVSTYYHFRAMGADGNPINIYTPRQNLGLRIGFAI